ncbi:MAG: hypothetical protein IJ543_03075 [Bacteroidales bacterium]|nr:hypothetical protein [Bacteroidales bacterium]
MKRICHIAVLIAIACSLISCAVNKKVSDYHVNDTSFSILDKYPNNQYEAMDSLLTFPKEVIGYLIGRMSDTTMAEVSTINVYSSYFPDLSKYWHNRGGLRYAIMLEFYLKDPLHSGTIDEMEMYAELQKLVSDSNVGAEVLWPCYRVTPSNLVFKYDNEGNPIFQVLSSNDILEIQKQYYEWWKRNKGKSLIELREIYKKDQGILRLPFKWYDGKFF